MNKYDFSVIALFYVPGTSITYSLEVKFDAAVKRYPRNNIRDIQILMDIINSKPGKFPYGAKCVSIGSIMVRYSSGFIRESKGTDYGIMDHYMLETEQEAIEKALELSVTEPYGNTKSFSLAELDEYRAGIKEDEVDITTIWKLSD